MTVRVFRAVVVSVLVLVSAGVSVPSNAGGASAQTSGGPPLRVLTPGETGLIGERLPVNVVFVGYEPGTGDHDVDLEAFLEVQSDLALGLSMMPLFHGRVVPSYTVIEPEYRVTFADDDFEDRLFGHLLDIGEERHQPTLYQHLYNHDPIRSLHIDDTLVIDAPSVEEWLATNVEALGIDAAEPTVFFLNWFGRDDFRFHVYAKSGEPATDTGIDFGLTNEAMMVAWGGSPAAPGEPARRVWFHDLSAGPDYITWNWNLTDEDVDGDGIADYRLPPVWEYGNLGGYRPFDDLSGDLGKILRYVAVDLLIASSPLYPPTISPPALPEEIGIDITRIGAPGMTAAPIDSGVIVQRLGEVQPWTTFAVEETARTYDGRLADVHRCWLSPEQDPEWIGTSCFGRRGDGFATLDLWLYLTDHWLQFASTDSDHSIPTLVFEVPDEEASERFIAMAGRSFVDGSQSHVVSYWTPRLDQAGIGQTDTLVHEVGHHLGLSHPHDGIDTDLDPETGIITVTLFIPTGPFHFAWVGSASSTVLNYLRNTQRFGQFDLDSMGRWMTATYLNQSNHVLALILDSPRASHAHDTVLAADTDALRALIAYDAMDYQAAAAFAKRAYDGLLDAADALAIPIEPQARPAAMMAPSPQRFFVDPVPPLFGERVAPPGPPAHQVPVELPGLGDLTSQLESTGVVWVPTGSHGEVGRVLAQPGG
jgi:hypothetical protein